METTLFLLIKIGAEDHMTRLLEQGEVYLNTVEKMREYDTTTGRGDPTEGRAFLQNYPAGTLEFDFMKGCPVRYERLTVAQIPTFPLGNLYCLYSFGRHHTVGLSEFMLDPRCANFGTHFVIIKHLPKFFTRMEQALTTAGLEYDHGLVKYYDEQTYSGNLSVFYKPKTFAYQQELRFHVQTTLGEPLILQLGSLVDIAEIHPVSALPHLKALPVGLRHVSEGFGQRKGPSNERSHTLGTAGFE